MKKISTLLMMMLFIASARSQNTYTWKGNNGASWETSTNWEPERSIPQSTDRLIFKTTLTVSNVPNQTVGSVTIEAGSTVTFTTADPGNVLTISNTTAPAFVIEGVLISNVNIVLADNVSCVIDGSLTVNNGTTFNTDGSGDLTNITTTGTLHNSGSITSTNVNRISFADGATYIHSENGGIVPHATWNAHSNCIIAGTVDEMPVGFDQAFGNFKWDCPNEIPFRPPTSANFSSQLTTVNGDLIITNTGTSFISLGSNDDYFTMTIGGDYIQTGGTIITDERIGYCTIFLHGNFTLSDGILAKHSPGVMSAVVSFSGPGEHLFTKTGGTISGKIDFVVENGSALNFGTSVLDGSLAGFKLNSGGKIITSHPGGLNSTGAIGSVQTATRTFSADADYEFRGASTGVFATTVNPQVKDLIINNTTGNITLAEPMTITGGLVLEDGELNTSTANLLTLVDGASVNGASDNSFINGPIQKTGDDDFVFPVGKSGTGYVPIEISGINGANSITNSFTAEYKRETPPNPTAITAAGIHHISKCEYWALDRTATNNNPVNITLYWNANNSCDATPYVTQVSSMRAVHYNTVTQQWDASSNNFGTGTNAAGSVIWANVNSFSPFALGTTSSTENPLPVMFANVKVHEKNGGIQIEWNNLAEKDVAEYTIEHSLNGKDFSAIARQFPTGNQGDKASYNAFDVVPDAGVNYYRIKAVEATGEIIYSNILSINLSTTNNALQLYPNPLNGNQVTISLSNIKRGQYNLRVVNSSGQDVYKQMIRSQSSSMTQTLDLPLSIKPGVYNIIVTGTNYREAKVFIVQ